MSLFSDRFEPRKMYIVGAMLSAISFFSFPLVENFLQISLMQIILGCSWSFFYVGGLRQVERKGKNESIVSTTTGLFNASISSAQITGPILALILYSRYSSYTQIMNVAGWVTTCSVIVYAFLVSYSSYAHNN